jgi:hypothetical protein
MSTPTEWPRPEWKWCWMRFRTSRRAKWRTSLVKVIKHDGRQFVNIFGQIDALSPAVCRSFEARFVQAEPPPKKWR